MRAALGAVLALGLAACDGNGAAALAASDVVILAPIPGQDRTVAYLTLNNRGDVPVTLSGISSPQFERVRMHATVVDDGVSRMQPLTSITIAAKSRAEFRAGGRHLMLIAPHGTLAPGDRVSLEFRFEPPAVPATLIVEAPLKERLPGANGR